MSNATDLLNVALAGRYLIGRHIGEGGMAAVYLAQDLKHDRKVALKLLKPELAALLGAERFLQEIRTTASLQHPHILPLFDSGTAEGFLFYVMPYVDGETLRDKLNRETQLGVDEAVRIARDVAEALDYAHRHGVIHRDIKPENILLHDGRPVVADFGIALAVSAAAGGRLTETGLSLGTPGYMSPEQATAEKEISGRSDIYSLGSVLYEMLAGTPPFVGASAQQIIRKIITDTPRPISELRKSVRPNVAAAVATALEKLPADRFETAKAFGDALGNPAFVGVDTAASASASGTTLMQRGLAFAPWVIAAAGLVALVASRSQNAPTSDPHLRFELTFPSDVAPILTGISPAFGLSRDGSRLVYQGQGEQPQGTRLFVRTLDELTSVPLKGTDGALRPQFSPDGRWIAFTLSGTLKKIPVLGGPATSIADSVGTFHWGDGDVVVFTRAGALWRVSAAGGVPTLVTTTDSVGGETGRVWPYVLPGGKAALFVILRGGVKSSGELAAVRLDGTSQVIPLNLTGMQPRYASGFIVAGNVDGHVVAVPFDASRLRVTGTPVTVLEGVEVKGGGATNVSIADNGTLSYLAAPSVGSDQIVRVDRSGREQVLVSDLGDFRGPRLSPEGRRLLVAQRVSGSRRDVWVYDIASGSRSRLTSDGGSDGASWSADGQRIAWVSTGTGGERASIRSQAWDGGGSAVTLSTPLPGPYYVSISRTGNFLVFEANPAGADYIAMLSLDSTHTITPLLATPATRANGERFAGNETQGSISPDGRWYAYVSDESGRGEVYVRTIKGGSGRVPVSAGGGFEPVWSPKGAEIFYRTGTHMVSARIAIDPEFRVLRRETLFADPYKQASGLGAQQAYDVTPDGTGFVMLKSLAASGQHLVLATHWSDELKQRMSNARTK